MGSLDAWLLRRRILAVTAIVIAVALLAASAKAQYQSFVQKDQLQGYGTFDLAKGAVDFLEREKITGPMFNTYGIGGYLIHRGYPDPSRKVFIDGRNVDYGFPFMNLVYLATKDPEQWKKLEDKYKFTYAVVDYDANREKEGYLQYSVHLDQNPSWVLVYIDDWAAVYLKDIPQNKAIIDRLRYRLITPTTLEFQTALDLIPEAQWPELEKELGRLARTDDGSIKGRLLLAKLLVRQKRVDEAYAVAQDALIARPGSAEPHAVLAAVFVVKGQWKEAADEFATTIRLAGDAYPDLDYGFVAGVFVRANRMAEARRYAAKAGKEFVELSPRALSLEGSGSTLPAESGSPAAPSSIDQPGTSPMVNPAADAIEFNDQAIALAEAGKFAEAREAFLNALKLNPSFATAWNNIGTLSFQEGKLDEAKQHYERAIQEFPDYPDAHFNLALLLYRMGDKKGSETHAKEAQRLGKDASQLLQMLGK